MPVFAEWDVLQSPGSSFFSISWKGNRKCGPSSSSSIKAADGPASVHSVNLDTSRHEGGGRTGAAAGFTGQRSL